MAITTVFSCPFEIFTPFAQQVIHVSSNKKGAIIQSLIWGAAYWLPDYKKLGY